MSPPGTEAGSVDEAVEPPTTMELAAPMWTMTELGERGADARVFAAAVGENLVVMSSTDDQLTAGVDAGDGWLPAEIGGDPRVDENTIEYEIGDGDVIAVYGPSDKEPPGCM